MSISINVITLLPHGLQPLLIFSERGDTFRTLLDVYLVWPETPADGAEPAVRLVALAKPGPSMNVGPQAKEIEDAFHLAATDGALHQASKFASNRVQRVETKTVEIAQLLAWRSLGYYSGLRSPVFDGHAAMHISQLPQGFGFLADAG